MGSLIALAGAISLMENQIKAMHENLAALKNAKLPKEKKKKEKKRAPVASTSKAAPTKPPKSNLKKKTKKNITDDDILTFEQKKDLSESISKLEGSKLEKVIQIIHEGVPEIRDVSNSQSCSLIGLQLLHRALKKSNSRSINYQLLS